jgi:hypothetical protein
VMAGDLDLRVMLPAGIPTGIPAGYLCGPSPVSSLILFSLDSLSGMVISLFYIYHFGFPVSSRSLK